MLCVPLFLHTIYRNRRISCVATSTLVTNRVYSVKTLYEVVGRRWNGMQGRIRHHRVRLIAYDALGLQQYCLSTRIPSPSPTPLAPLVPTKFFPSSRKRPMLRKVRLTYEARKIANR
jgi:hypothetical protein